MGSFVDRLQRILGMQQNEPKVKEIHKAAAAWWAQFLQAEDVDHSTGEPRDLFGEALSSWVRDKVHGDGYDDETIDAFREALATNIAEYAHELEFGTPYISVDYHPDPRLKQACESVGIKPGMTLFPKKTGMWLEDDEILVKAGHGAEREVIWPEGSQGPEERDGDG